jgi:hypothetical protein
MNQITEITSGSDSGQIKFPALTFNQGWVGAIESIEDISRPSRLGVKRGFYRQLTLVDSNLGRFKVVAAKKVGTRFDANFRMFLRLLGGNPVRQMQLTLGVASELSLNDVKDLILDCFKKQEEYWEEMSDFEEFRDEIVAAMSMDQIFSAFREFNLMDSERR